MGGWYVVYIIACVVNAVLASTVADLHLWDWEYWVWLLIPAIGYMSGWKRRDEED